MAARLDEHALFRRLSAAEAAADVAAGMLTSATEEGIKVARNSGQVHNQEAFRKVFFKKRVYHWMIAKRSGGECIRCLQPGLPACTYDLLQ